MPSRHNSKPSLLCRKHVMPLSAMTSCKHVVFHVDACRSAPVQLASLCFTCCSIGSPIMPHTVCYNGRRCSGRNALYYNLRSCPLHHDITQLCRCCQQVLSSHLRLLFHNLKSMFNGMRACSIAYCLIPSVSLTSIICLIVMQLQECIKQGRDYLISLSASSDNIQLPACLPQRLQSE